MHNNAPSSQCSLSCQLFYTWYTAVDTSITIVRGTGILLLHTLLAVHKKQQQQCAAAEAAAAAVQQQCSRQLLDMRVRRTKRRADTKTRYICIIPGR